MSRIATAAKRIFRAADSNAGAHTILGVIVILKIITHVFALFPRSIHLGQGVVPWLMAQDFTLYSSIWEHRPPVTAFAVFLSQQLLGIDTLDTVKLLHLIAVVATLLGIYVVTLRLSRHRVTALLAVIYFALLESIFLNVAFYFEIVIGVLLIAALWLMIGERIDGKHVLGTGILLGLAFFTKQQAIILIGVMGLWLVLAIRDWRIIVPYSIGLAVPTAIIVGGYLISGHWDDYFYWNYTFNFSSSVEGQAMPSGDLIRRIIITHGWLLPLALFAIKKRDRSLWLVIGLGLAAQAMHLPRYGDIHAATGLPLVSIAFGIVTGAILHPDNGQDRLMWTHDKLIAMGSIGILIAAILSNVLTSYIPTEAGFGAVLGMTEFSDVVVKMDELARENDTLYVFPEGDSTAQLHPLTGLRPPGTWTILNEIFLARDDIVNDLLAEWQVEAPTWIIWFPELTDSTFPPTAQPLLDFMHQHYQVEATVPFIFFYGEAVIMRLDE